MSASFWDKLRGVFTGDDAAPETSSGLFVMKVEDVFSISGRGVVVTGRVEAGSVRRGDGVVLRSASGATRRCRVSGIEKFRKTLETAAAGDNVGLLLAGVEKGDIARGDMLGNA